MSIWSNGNWPRLTRLAIVSAAIPLLAGCLVMKYGEEAPKPFQEADLSFIEPGVTSRADLLTLMGQPSQRLNEDQLWVYESVYHGKWFGFIVPMVGDAGIVGAEPSTWRTDTPFFLMVDFGSAGTVESYRVVSVKDPCEVCIAIAFDHGGAGAAKAFNASWHYLGAFAVVEPKHADRTAKQFVTTADQCSVYLYSGWPLRHLFPLWVQVWLDGAPAGLLPTARQYLHWSLPPGAHQFFLRSRKEDRLQTIDCRAGELLFVRVGARKNVGSFFDPEIKDVFDVEVDSASEGKTHIKKRKLVYDWWVAPESGRVLPVPPESVIDTLVRPRMRRQEVLALLGEPDAIWSDQSLIIYTNDGRAWNERIGASNAMPLLGDRYVFTVQFDVDDTVKGTEVRRLNDLSWLGLARGDLRPGEQRWKERVSYNCSPFGMCFGRSVPVIWFDSKTADEEAKTHKQLSPEGFCSIFVYPDLPGIGWIVEFGDGFKGILEDGLQTGYLWRLRPAGMLSMKARHLNAAGEVKTAELTTECRSRKSIGLKLVLLEDGTPDVQIERGAMMNRRRQRIANATFDRLTNMR